MSDTADLSFDPTEFRGTARLFPLPNFVLFPGLMQPLHIFEPRYRALLADALEGDRLIAMALLTPGWEENYLGCPPIAPVACLGRIVTHQMLPDGCSNLLLMGVKRVRVERELPSEFPFRQAVATVLEDFYPAQVQEGDASTECLRHCLLTSFQEHLPKLPAVKQQLAPLLEGQLLLGTLTDLIAAVLPVAVRQKWELLAECDVYSRARILIRILDRLPAGGSDCPLDKFPPDFSCN